ncbi:uncharacterized protein ColSpa_05771 [Colletotrichum spaethianum]|uniref:Uncharacterized protein n=1 Tax=Colletotrichum spaethianum TaxID=700344 RepID=A0AA37P0G7_9PEZI|nr:uncharacterized protein ColSpa_05771 [Colletotrichum spaethianum]GKT45590.1 hypothetical protein ColSpa_05771 [Colletotrichum spaethianum]
MQGRARSPRRLDPLEAAAERCKPFAGGRTGLMPSDFVELRESDHGGPPTSQTSGTGSSEEHGWVKAPGTAVGSRRNASAV